MNDQPATERYVNQQISLFELKLKGDAAKKELEDWRAKNNRMMEWLARTACFVIGLALGIWIMLILLVHK